MDRFIAASEIYDMLAKSDLKSNMDRFIVLQGFQVLIGLVFKIQYG